MQLNSGGITPGEEALILAQITSEEIIEGINNSIENVLAEGDVIAEVRGLLEPMTSGRTTTQRLRLSDGPHQVIMRVTVTTDGDLKGHLLAGMQVIFSRAPGDWSETLDNTIRYIGQWLTGRR